MSTHSENHAVPIIDISAFVRDGDSKSITYVARQLADKVSLNGCIGISGHGLSDSALSEAFAMTKKLFDLPHSEKMKAPHPDGPIPHRGYSGTGRERGAAKTESEDWEGKAKASDYAGITDYKESYEIGSEDNKVQYNIWLPEEVFSGFREWGLKLYWELNKVALAILDALLMSLDLSDEEKQSLRALHTGHENQVRLLHYPPVLDDAAKHAGVHRLGAHTDWR